MFCSSVFLFFFFFFFFWIALCSAFLGFIYFVNKAYIALFYREQNRRKDPHSKGKLKEIEKSTKRKNMQQSLLGFTCTGVIMTRTVPIQRNAIFLLILKSLEKILSNRLWIMKQQRTWKYETDTLSVSNDTSARISSIARTMIPRAAVSSSPSLPSVKVLPVPVWP